MAFKRSGVQFSPAPPENTGTSQEVPFFFFKAGGDAVPPAFSYPVGRIGLTGDQRRTALQRGLLRGAHGSPRPPQFAKYAKTTRRRMARFFAPPWRMSVLSLKRRNARRHTMPTGLNQGRHRVFPQNDRPHVLNRNKAFPMEDAYGSVHRP